MADETIVVRNLDEIQRTLFLMGKRLGNDVVKKSLRQGANVIRDAARNKAPVRTGKLRKNIVVGTSKINTPRKKTGVIGVFIGVNVTGKANNPRNAFYWRFVEDGWNTRGVYIPGQRPTGFGKRSGRKTQRGKRDIPGRKYIARAYLSSRNKAVNVTIRAAEIAAGVLAKRLGLKSG